ncbi:MAG: type VI secretion system tube protein Hcp [Bacteroidota bacterium]|nr:type VI secretion system tube protein Hcp [Bacteroidota bacterium]MDP4231411.1 type VI secretion system tube protein Hcp [Bacteroidota bacterium]MDP4237151.1 type VI secretion system tube protein Hcp [Bacteroidota bacterium]
MKTRTRFTSISIIVFLFTLLISANSFAAVDAYLVLEGTNVDATFKCKIDGAGECDFKDVKPGTYKVTLVASPEYFTSHGSDGKTIEISSFSFGVSNPTAAGSSGGMGTGKVSMSSFSIMKKNDKSSPKLFDGPLAPPTGGFTNKRCDIMTRKAGSDHQDYLQVTLQTITVSGSNENPTESVQRKSAGYNVKASVKV